MASCFTSGSAPAEVMYIEVLQEGHTRITCEEILSGLNMTKILIPTIHCKKLITRFSRASILVSLCQKASCYNGILYLLNLHQNFLLSGLKITVECSILTRECLLQNLILGRCSVYG